MNEFYFLVNDRSWNFIHNILNFISIEYGEMSSVYNVPQYSSDPILVFDKASDLTEYLVLNPTVDYSVYWILKTQKDWSEKLVAIFTDDGALILGVVFDVKFISNISDIIKEFNLEEFYLCLEDIPEANGLQFKKNALKQKSETLSILNV